MMKSDKGYNEFVHSFTGQELKEFYGLVKEVQQRGYDVHAILWDALNNQLKDDPECYKVDKAPGTETSHSEDGQGLPNEGLS